MPSPAPHTLPLKVLQRRCARQSARFFQQKPHDPRYCLEIFRRAIEMADADAWAAIYCQYRPLLDSWFRRHPLASALAEAHEQIIAHAFERFWQALTPQKFAAFSGLAAILRYLQLCVHAALTDCMRQRQRSVLLVEDGEALLEDLCRPEKIYNPEAQALRREGAARLWAWVEAHCRDARERLLMHESLVLGMRPMEICTRHPDLFPDVRIAYRIKENLLARLRRSPQAQEMLELAG